MVQGNLINTSFNNKASRDFEKFLRSNYPNIIMIEKYVDSRTSINFKDINNNIIRRRTPRFFKDSKIFSGDFAKEPPYIFGDFLKENKGKFCFANYIFNHPDTKQYFQNIDDIPDFIDMNERIEIVCPVCGSVKLLKALTITSSPISEWSRCNNCSDGKSFPNKVLGYILTYFSPQNFKTEYASDWTKNRRYDGYFQLNEKEYVVEMDGKQHFEDGSFNFKGKRVSIDLKKQQEIDKIKDKLAKENNVEIIRINCSGCNDEIIENIEGSLLGKLFNFSNFDWKKCFLECSISNMKKVWDAYNLNSLSTKDIARQLQLSSSTVMRYLRMGACLGICNYSGEKELLKNLQKASESNQKRIVVYGNNIEKEFISIQKAAEFLSERFNLKVSSSRDYISKRLNTSKNYKGFYFKEVREEGG